MLQAYGIPWSYIAFQLSVTGITTFQPFNVSHLGTVSIVNTLVIIDQLKPLLGPCLNILFINAIKWFIKRFIK